MHYVLKYRNEEWLNSISHGLGTIFSIIGLVLLLEKNSNKSSYAIFCILIYSFTLISMFAVSSAYHGTSNLEFRKKLRIFDHINIYFLIAGTYTPISLITLINGNGWKFFYTVWIIAGLGTLFKVFYTGKLEFLSLLLYVLMGWLIIIDFDNLLDYTPPIALNLIMLGGSFYTLGILFYAWERIPYNHFVWHLFVLGGAFCHWLAIYEII